MGQALYIAAEHAGVQGTGIGAYFGTWTHEVLGIDSCALQDVYHFVVGASTADGRWGLQPYEHLGYYRSLSRDAVDTTDAWAVVSGPGSATVLHVGGDAYSECAP